MAVMSPVSIVSFPQVCHRRGVLRSHPECDELGQERLLQLLPAVRCRAAGLPAGLADHGEDRPPVVVHHFRPLDRHGVSRTVVPHQRYVFIHSMGFNWNVKQIKIFGGLWARRIRRLKVELLRPKNFSRFFGWRTCSCSPWLTSIKIPLYFYLQFVIWVSFN